MKMIYVGSLATEPDRDSGWIVAFRALGCEVIPFSSHIEYVQNSFFSRIARRFNIGSQNSLMQKRLIALINEKMPDWVHFRLPISFDRSTIELIKENRILATQYFNDDPFSKKSPFALHWKFLKALSSYDGHFVYRAHNVKGYINRGANSVEHCPPAYNPGTHFDSRIKLDHLDYLADVAFIGHYEDDFRLACLERLNQCGFSIILKGGMWEPAVKRSTIAYLAPIKHAFGGEYRKIYANVIAGLCFFSKINNDSWTERALEIVALGGLLVCERTEEAKSYFVDREEAFFFSSIDELVTIIYYLKNNPEIREKVQAAGYRKLLQGSHTISDRANQIYRFAVNHINNRRKTNKAD